MVQSGPFFILWRSESNLRGAQLKNKPSLGTVYSIQNKITTITKMTNPNKMYRAIVKEFVCMAMRSVLHICEQKNIGMISQIYLISCEIWCKIPAV